MNNFVFLERLEKQFFKLKQSECDNEESPQRIEDKTRRKAKQTNQNRD